MFIAELVEEFADEEEEVKEVAGRRSILAKTVEVLPHPANAFATSVSPTPMRCETIARCSAVKSTVGVVNADFSACIFGFSHFSLLFLFDLGFFKSEKF